MKDDGAQSAQTERLAALGFMLASVCHEISNPLAAVSSMLQILQSKRGITPETREKSHNAVKRTLDSEFILDLACLSTQ